MSSSQRFTLVRAESSKRAGASWSEALLRRLLRGLRYGELRARLPNGAVVTVAGPQAGPYAVVELSHWRAMLRVALGGGIGFAEGFVAGEWTSPDLVALMRLAARNARTMERAVDGSVLLRIVERLRHLGRANTRRGSRRNITAHYDLGNEFYALWLDEAMQYSSGLFVGPDDTLEAAQEAKLARIAQLLRLRGGEATLEIGCGWGGLAARLAGSHGANVTALTLSHEQRAWAAERVEAQGFAGRVEVRLEDYRDAVGVFDRIVSIEMLEAVGEAWWPTYFNALQERLRPGGLAVLQVITIAEDRLDGYRRSPDFIQKHIFPGGFLPTLSALESEIARSGLALAHRETFGCSYARTLAAWRSRFLARWPQIERLGFDERFRRLWTYYLSYCEGAFLEGAIDVGLYVVERPADQAA
jgi:cyclopropane-fatty-acyl-phospholipid synthase